MIVTCGECKTRFKIPDEKVSPEKGVKVRCTKCGHTFRVFRDPSRAPTDLSPQHEPSDHDSTTKPDLDPFARFGAAAQVGPNDRTRPGYYALGVELSRGAVNPGDQQPPSPRQAENRPPAPFDFSAIAPKVAQPAGTSPPTPAAFDFSALTMPPPPGPASDPGAVASTPAFDFSSLGSPSSPPPMNQTTSPGGFLEGDSTTQTPPPVPAIPAASPPATADAFFGAPLETEARKPLLDLPDDLSPEAAKGALFELPTASPPSEAAAVGAIAPSAEAAVPAEPIGGVRAPVEAHAPAPRRRRTILGVVVNVVIAVFLVAGLLVAGSALLNEGKLSRETLSLEALTAVVAPSTEFSVSDISNGLYETKAGRAVFFVRGQLTNHGRTTTRVAVQADIVESASVVRSARSLAGAVPTPEELYELDLAQGDDLSALAERLAPRALALEPKASAGFLVVFAEYPPDLKAFRVRVSARAEPGGSTARRP